MAEKPIDITVVHLVWLPFGAGQFRHFLEAYRSYAAGYPHQLFFVFNGVQQEQELLPYLQLADEAGMPYRYLSLHKGQDIDAYHQAALALTSHYLLLLNSYSGFRAQNWLEKYVRHAGPGTALAATASCQSHYSLVFQQHSWAWERGKGLAHHFRKYKLLLKAMCYWRWLFPPFPNPHLRTNGLLLPRQAFLEAYPGPVGSKFRAYQFESGRRGLTRQLLKKGFQLRVIDRYGKAYPMDAWASSNTFWAGGQENLLITDNQTALYDQADAVTRNKLAYLAWAQHG